MREPLCGQRARLVRNCQRQDVEYVLGPMHSIRGSYVDNTMIACANSFKAIHVRLFIGWVAVSMLAVGRVIALALAAAAKLQLQLAIRTELLAAVSLHGQAWTADW